MADMSQIVSSLNALTNQNRVPWKATSDRSAFVAVYGDLSVRISSRGEEPRNIVVLGVYDGQGNILETASYDASLPLLPLMPRPSPEGSQLNLPPRKDYSELQPLYQAARRIALAIDQNLVSLLERINASPPVSSE